MAWSCYLDDVPRRPGNPGSTAGGEPETVTSFGERAARFDVALSVVAEGYIGVYPLPVRGSVTIGRDALAEFSVDHASLSRRHARIDVGGALTIEDLGSKNGTRVGDDALAPGEKRALSIGDTVLLGGVRMVVLAWGARGPHPALLGMTAFRSRVEYECARAGRAQRACAVVRVRVEGSSTAAQLAELVTSVLGPERATAALGPADFAAIAAPPSDDTAILERQLRSALSPKGLTLRFGVAVHPADGPSPEALLSAAEALANGREARAGVAGRTITVVDASMVRLHALARRVAVTNVSVLLLGETGCGKEILAEVIHAASPRKDRPFVRLNCASLPGSLIESELFGHERGAFSGAVQAKAGMLETAHGGTALLDEVGELPLELQAKLLRFLEDGQIQRLGGVRPRHVDVRVVAATNRDLERDSRSGRFRPDLYHRLNGFTLHVPPLRDRRDEIAVLAAQFLDEAAKEQGRRVPRVSPDALARLQEHAWPGNVRELRNVVRAALIICGDDAELTAGHVPLQGPPPSSASSRRPRTRSAPAAPARAATGPFQDPEEGARIAEALERCGGNQAHAAEQLGVSRTTLLKRMLAFGLRPPQDAGPYADPDERRRVVEALAACGGNRSKAAALLRVSRSTLVMRMLAFGLHHPEDAES